MKYAVYVALAPLLFVGTTLFLLLYSESGKEYTAGRGAFLPEVKLPSSPVLVVVQSMTLQQLDAQKEDWERGNQPVDEEWMPTSGLVVKSRLFQYHFPLRMKRKEGHVEEAELGVDEERVKELAEARAILSDMQELERAALQRSRT